MHTDPVLVQFRARAKARILLSCLLVSFFLSLFGPCYGDDRVNLRMDLPFLLFLLLSTIVGRSTKSVQALYNIEIRYNTFRPVLLLRESAFII